MKKILTILAIGVIIFLFADNGSTNPIQWTGNGHWYERVDLNNGISWNDAKTAAEAKGGYLATITSLAEDTFVINNLIIPVQNSFPNRPRNGDWFPYWIGGYQTPPSTNPNPSLDWHWVTGEPWSYTNWLQFEPNDAYGAGIEDENSLTYWIEDQRNNLYGWNDLRGDSYENRIGYFVEYNTNPIPEPATMLLIGSGLIGLAGLRRKFKN